MCRKFRSSIYFVFGRGVPEEIVLVNVAVIAVNVTAVTV